MKKTNNYKVTFLDTLDSDLFIFNMGYDYCTEHEIEPINLKKSLGRDDFYIKPVKLFNFVLYNKQIFYNKRDVNKYKCNKANQNILFKTVKVNKRNIYVISNYNNLLNFEKYIKDALRPDEHIFCEYDETYFAIITKDEMIYKQFYYLVQSNNLYFINSNDGPSFCNLNGLKNLLNK